MIREMTMAAKLQAAKEQRNAELEEALAKIGAGSRPDDVTMPSGLRVRLKRTPLSQLLGGNPLNPEGSEGGDDELLKMLKVTRGS